MDWAQALTIIGTTLAAVVYIHKDIKADMKERHAEYTKQFEENRKEFAETRKKSDAEFAETRKLWAELLKEIHAIKLFHGTKDRKSSK